MDNITLLHQFMVKACLASAKEDREAWVRKWEEIIVIEDMDYSSMRLVPLFLHRNIESGISTKHDKRLKIIYKHWWLRTRHIIDQLKKVHSAINNRGIGVVVIKGASIITRYELPELRPMSDFDLLIKPGEINACLTILKDMGYSPNKPLQYRILLKHKSLLTEFVHGLECVHAVTGTKIDLHWRIGSLCSWQFTDDLWSHLDNYTPIPHARKPQLAYEAFMTITHALVNGNYNNLNWIIDVDLLNKSTGSSFWEKARQLAVAEKKEDIFDYGCAVLLKFGVYAPEPKKVKRPPVIVYISNENRYKIALWNLYTIQIKNFYLHLKYLFPHAGFSEKLYLGIRRIRLIFIFKKFAGLNRLPPPRR